ncbi:MAG: AAA family ATPase [Candidatus Saccharibacteria bacterium]
MDKSKLGIIGIAGTNGSGKDTLGHILSQHNYLFISVTELLRDECKRRNIIADRENLRIISAEWRRESGLGVLVDKAKAEYDKVSSKYVGLAIASLRNPGEADRVHELSGTVIWLDADPKLRYKRVQDSSQHRSHRADEDNKTFEEFLAEEQVEMHASGDEATLDMAAVQDRADISIDNSHDKTADFKVHIEELLDLN